MSGLRKYTNLFFHGGFFKIHFIREMKNVAKCCKDYFGYFNALETHSDIGWQNILAFVNGYFFLITTFAIIEKLAMYIISETKSSAQ